ncbi:pyridoxamine 5'-phosphate oxidase family protein [Anaerovorax odorimutans]|uniref:Pyridoxamine 5'-phosphate oxidase family protein n=2 Tax=Anaerovorax odorimutans TaxID=109327 RepID=A0ABT1RSM2_9FIRM|nr:pyridoxamine 5'-phosphate oxidase family protein [Anaerovorax odorimutans]
MRLKEENQLPREEAVKILENNTHGVLALDGDDGYPYAVPVSYAYDSGKIYFHGTSEGGHKLDAIKRNSKVSFCVVEKDDILPADFNTLYLSAIAFGQARIIENDEEKQQALERILEKYSADFMESGRKYTKAVWDEVCTVEITIEHLTAKKGV